MTDSANGQLSAAEEAAEAAGYGVLVQRAGPRPLPAGDDEAEGRRAAAEARRRNDEGLPPPPLPGSKRKRSRPPRPPGSPAAVTAAALGITDVPLPDGVTDPVPVPPAFTMPSPPVTGLTASARLVSPELLAMRDAEKARLMRLREAHMEFVHQIDLALAGLRVFGTASRRGRPPGGGRAGATYSMLRRYAAEAWNPEDGPITASAALEWIKDNGWHADVMDEMGTVASCLAHLVRRDPSRWARTGTGEYAWTPPE